MSETFTCAMCGGTFPMGDDDEARAELKDNFGDVIQRTASSSAMTATSR